MTTMARGEPATNGGREAQAVPVRVMLVDDHEVIRCGLRALLGEAREIEIVAEADNGYEAVRLVADLRPEVVIMDVVMPGMDGIDATRRIKQHQPETRIIGLSMFDGEGVAEKMLAAGADFHISKSRAGELLLDAIFRRPARRP